MIQGVPENMRHTDFFTLYICSLFWLNLITFRSFYKTSVKSRFPILMFFGINWMFAFGQMQDPGSWTKWAPHTPTGLGN